MINTQVKIHLKISSSLTKADGRTTEPLAEGRAIVALSTLEVVAVHAGHVGLLIQSKYALPDIGSVDGQRRARACDHCNKVHLISGEKKVKMDSYTRKSVRQLTSAS